MIQKGIAETFPDWNPSFILLTCDREKRQGNWRFVRPTSGQLQNFGSSARNVKAACRQLSSETQPQKAP